MKVFLKYALPFAMTLFCAGLQAQEPRECTATNGELSECLPPKTIPPLELPQPTEDPPVLQKKLGAYESQIGLKLYEEGDDYRAITALKRFRILDPQAGEFVASLIIAEINRRNDKAEIAATEFDRAAHAAPTPDEEVWASILSANQLCIPLSYYMLCTKRLREFQKLQLSQEQRQLVDYQVLYTDVVLRQDIKRVRGLGFTDAEMSKRAQSLVKRHFEFDDLPTKSPVVAGILSGVLPGAGQLYNGRPVDGLVGLLLVAASGLGTWYAYEELDSLPLAIVGGVITLGFYSGTIVNAVVDSHRINAEIYREFFRKLEVDYWPVVGFDVKDDTVTFGWRWQ